jgi:hypothetical protein
VAVSASAAPSAMSSASSCTAARGVGERLGRARGCGAGDVPTMAVAAWLRSPSPG